MFMYDDLEGHAPKSMPRKETKKLLSILKEIRRTATMERANFFVFDDESESKMLEIKKLTHVWRTSWILSPLDYLIERYEKVLAET